jgi:protein-disulfide isomerase
MSSATPGSSADEPTTTDASTRSPRRRRRALAVLIAVAVVALIAAAGIGGPAAWRIHQRDAAQNAAQLTPPGVDPTTLGYIVGPADTASSAPEVVVYEDFQCVICQQVNAVYFPTLEALATHGNIRLRVVDMALWDSLMANNASTRAAIAVGCAATVGDYLPYRQALFDTQAAPARLPWTDVALRGDVATAAGLSGQKLDSFQQCYNNLAARDFVASVNQKVTSSGLAEGLTTGSGPIITVNGHNPQVAIANSDGVTTDWWRQLDGTQGAWMAAIVQAAQA